MAASIATVRKLVYEYLRVNTQGAYGTYLANERYPSAYIDDEIYSADLEIVNLLLKNKQDSLLLPSYESEVTAHASAVPLNWSIISVAIYPLGLAPIWFQEIDIDFYETLRDSEIFNTASYGNYYAIRDATLLLVDESAEPTITYINLDRTAGLKSPDGFDHIIAFLAASRMLMNREDRPEHSKYLYSQFMSNIQQYLLPENQNQAKEEDTN